MKLGNANIAFKFSKEADVTLPPLHREYLDEEYDPKPGDYQLILAAEGADVLYDIFRQFRDKVAVKGIQFERIEAMRFAGRDRHVDRGKLHFKVNVIAGPPPHKKAVLRVILNVKDGEVQEPMKFIDASNKERELSEEALVKYLNLQEQPLGRRRRVKDTDISHIDRTLYPAPKARSMFRDDPARDVSAHWRNLGLG